jgi:hypothetical protein
VNQVEQMVNTFRDRVVDAARRGDGEALRFSRLVAELLIVSAKTMNDIIHQAAAQAPGAFPDGARARLCSECDKPFDIYEGVELKRGGRQYGFNVLANSLGFICPRCTLKLCKEVVLQYEKEGRAE